MIREQEVDTATEIMLQRIITGIALAAGHLQKTGVIKLRPYLTDEQRTEEIQEGEVLYYMNHAHLSKSIMEAGKVFLDSMKGLPPAGAEPAE